MSDICVCLFITSSDCFYSMKIWILPQFLSCGCSKNISSTSKVVYKKVKFWIYLLKVSISDIWMIYFSMKLHTKPPFVKPLNASMHIKISYRLFKNNLDPKAMPNLSHFWVKLEYFKRCLPSFWLESHVQNIGRIFVTFQKQTSLYIYQSGAWGVVSKKFYEQEIVT